MSVLIVIARRIHANNTASELKHVNLNFKCYLDRKKTPDFKNGHRFIVSLESIMKLPRGFKPDVIILDEARTISENCNSTTLWDSKARVNPVKSLNRLKHMYSKAMIRIAADADTAYDNCVYKLLRGLDGCHIHELRAKRNKLKRSILIAFGSSQASMLSDKNDTILCRALLDCKKSIDNFDPTTGIRRVAIACGSMNKAKDYARYCDAKDIPYKLYCSDSSDSYENDFKDPDAAWEDLGVIIFTSKLSVAVDPKTTKFEHLFIHTCRRGSTSRNLLQGIDRFGRLIELLANTQIVCLIGDTNAALHQLRMKCNVFQIAPPISINACISDYDDTNARSIQQILSYLSSEKVEFVHKYEIAKKNRKGMLKVIKTLQKPKPVPPNVNDYE